MPDTPFREGQRDTRITSGVWALGSGAAQVEGVWAGVAQVSVRGVMYVVIGDSQAVSMVVLSGWY